VKLASLEQVREHLLHGGVAAIPTETVYGLAALASDVDAVSRVFSLKARPFFDPLIVHIGEWEQLNGIITGFSAEEEALTRAFWPGPLTIVTPKRREVSDMITSGFDTVAVRMPQHPLTLELLRTLNEPVVAPSANQFGRTSPTTAEHVAAEFPDAEILILDGGPCTVGIESTVVQFHDGALSILRPGGVTVEQLQIALEKAKLSIPVGREASGRSPGNVKHHYQPRVPLVLAERKVETREISAQLGRTILKLSTVVLPQDPVLAARSLYSAIRAADAGAHDAILLEWNYPKDGMWEAIWDRVTRAATVVIGA